MFLRQTCNLLNDLYSEVLITRSLCIIERSPLDNLLMAMPYTGSYLSAILEALQVDVSAKSIRDVLGLELGSSVDQTLAKVKVHENL